MLSPRYTGELLAIELQQGSGPRAPVHPIQWAGSRGQWWGDTGAEAGTLCTEFCEEVLAWPSWCLLTITEQCALMHKSLARQQAGERVGVKCH